LQATIMRHLRIDSKWIAPLALGALLMGCTAEAPTAGHGGDTGPNSMQDLKPAPADMAKPNTGHIDPPRLDAITQLTAFTSLPVHGTADAGASVLIDGTANGSVSALVESSGRFCADVKLAVGTANTLTLRAIDEYGNQSDPVQLIIQQGGTPSAGPPPPVPTNASMGGAASSQSIGITSTSPGQYAIDGNMQTAIEGHYLNDNIWPWQPQLLAAVVVQLAQPSRIDRVRAIAATDCPFSAPLDLYYTTADAPSSPDVAAAGVWIKLTTVKSQDLTQATADLPSTAMTHVAVMWPLGDWNCGNVSPYYGLAELEAWTTPNVPPPVASAPSCGGGG
jgi:hypothetical protein